MEPFDGFDWDDGNRDKCCKHGLSVIDIEHVLTHAETLIVPDEKNSKVEPRFLLSAAIQMAATPWSFSRRAEQCCGRSVRDTCTGRRSINMRKKFPVLKTDEEAEAFLQQDLSDYLHADNFKPMRFEFQPKEKSINLRISEPLLKAVQANAKREGIPYQRYIRQALEKAITQKR